MGKNNKIKKFFKRYYQIMLLVFVMLFSVMAVAGNVLRNEKLIDNTKKDSSSSTVTDTMKDSSIKELDINSSLVRQLYSIAYDNRYGLKDSFIYPDMDKIIIGEMEFSNKMRLVLSNLENNKYTSSDCNTNLGNTYRYNNKTYTCKVSSKGRIDAQTILDKYRDLYGNTDNFDTSVPIVEDGLLNNIYLYGIDKKTNQASYYLYQTKEEVVKAIVTAIGEAKGLDMTQIAGVDFAKFKEIQYNILADALRKHMDISRIYEIMEEGTDDED